MNIGQTYNMGRTILCDKMIKITLILHFVKLVEIEGLNCYVWISGTKRQDRADTPLFWVESVTQSHCGTYHDLKTCPLSHSYEENM